MGASQIIHPLPRISLATGETHLPSEDLIQAKEALEKAQGEEGPFA